MKRVLLINPDYYDKIFSRTKVRVAMTREHFRPYVKSVGSLKVNFLGLSDLIKNLRK